MSAGDASSTGDLRGVSETLLVPLVGRARASEWHETFRDPQAQAIVAQLGDALPRDLGSRRTRVSSVLRAARIDACARAFCEANPGALVVNLGAGYDTRFHRLDDGRLRCVDVDLPPVIEGKRQLFDSIPGAQSERYRLVACSITDPRWLDELAWQPGEPVVLVAEGVLAYLQPAEVHTLLARARARFGGCELVLDWYSPLVVRLKGAHPKVSTGRAELHFGLRSARDLPGAELLGEWLLSTDAGRYDVLARLLSWVPGVRRLQGVSHVRFSAPAADEAAHG